MSQIWLLGLNFNTALAAPIRREVLIHVSSNASAGLSWGSIALAVLTALLQGLVTAMASMTESSNQWTFRFRLALVEHWWWTFVSFLLLMSLIMNALSFATGNSSQPLSVLVLASATFLALVQYTLPAWQFRHFNSNRWFAWTNSSRTTVPEEKTAFCGDEAAWRQLTRDNATELASETNDTPSDKYGWHIWPARGMPQDPADVLNVTNSEVSKVQAMDKWIYDNGNPDSSTKSLLWGVEQGFRRRVSRAISAVPRGLLESDPFTTDGYGARGLTLAFGILGRNKGLDPGGLVFKIDRNISTMMENRSTWRPRPSKTNRSYFQKPAQEQYGKISPDFVDATVELSLLMMDMPHWAIEEWLAGGFEHQSLDTNRFLRELQLADQEEKKEMLKAHYDSSYVSMIISLNNMNPGLKTPSSKGKNLLGRPDIMCTGLLLKARGYDEPSWWNRENVSQRRRNQTSVLGQESGWKEPMAKLLGLSSWPVGFENQDSVWG
jgi:hypothetical protein